MLRQATHPVFVPPLRPPAGGCGTSPWQATHELASLSGSRREAEEEAVYARLATEVTADVLAKYFEEGDRA